MRMTRVWQGLNVLLSLAIGLVVGELLTWVLVLRALNHEHFGQPTFWTHVVGRGYMLPVIALAVVLFSPQPVMHTVGLVVGVTVVFQLSTGEWRESDWHFPVLAAATLAGCAAARLGRNYALTFSGSVSSELSESSSASRSRDGSFFRKPIDR